MCMPLIICFCNFNHPLESRSLRLLLHFGHSGLTILIHEIIIFQIWIIFYCFFNLLSSQILPIIVLFNYFLLSLEDIFTCRFILFCFPISFFNVKVLPFCCHSSCHMFGFSINKFNYICFLFDL